MAISFKNVGFKKDNQRFEENFELVPMGIKTPLRENSFGPGPFQMTFDPVEQLADNLRNLIQTNHGERLGRFKYGANLRDIVFDLTAKDDFDAEVAFRIKEAVSRYIPQIELDELETAPLKIKRIDDTNRSLAKILVKVKFNIPILKSFGNVAEVILYVGG